MSVRLPWLRRWPWFLAAAALAAGIVVPFSIRARGRARYAEEKARLAAAGLGGGLEELRRDAPAVDGSVQGRWRRMVGRAVGSRLQAGLVKKVPIADWMVAGGPEPEGARALYEGDAELRAAAAALFAEGKPVAGGLGNWIASGGGRIRPLAGVRTENLLGVRALANLFLVQAAFEENPEPALEALDRMDAAFAWPGTLIDGMIGVCVADARDETYCRLAAARRLPPAAAARWLAEEPPEPLRGARSLRGERLLFLEPVADGIVAGTLSGAFLDGNMGPLTGPGQWFERRASASAWWLHGGEACARVLGYYGDAERALREGRPLPGSPESGDAAGELAGVVCGNLQAVATNLLMARQRHRLARAFVRALDSPEERVLPPATALDLPLIVERPAANRLRLRVDSSVPLPLAWKGYVFPDLPLKPEEQHRPFLWRYGFVEADLPVAGK